MFNIMRRLASRYAVLLMVTFLVLAVFEFIIPAVISTMNLPSLVGGALAMLPSGAAAALADQIFGGLSPLGLLGFGWNHPIAHTVGTTLAVVLGARAVAGESDMGTLELVLAQPIARRSYLTANTCFALFALVLFCAFGMLGTFLGLQFFEIPDVNMRHIGMVATNLFLLLATIYAITLLASVHARDGGRALGIGVLVAVVSFLVFTVALLWPAAAFMGKYTLHAYYYPREVIATGRIAVMPLVVLLGGTMLCLALAFWSFARRDIT